MWSSMGSQEEKVDQIDVILFKIFQDIEYAKRTQAIDNLSRNKK